MFSNCQFAIESHSIQESGIFCLFPNGNFWLDQSVLDLLLNRITLGLVGFRFVANLFVLRQQSINLFSEFFVLF